MSARGRGIASHASDCAAPGKLQKGNESPGRAKQPHRERSGALMGRRAGVVKMPSFGFVETHPLLRQAVREGDLGRSVALPEHSPLKFAWWCSALSGRWAVCWSVTQGGALALPSLCPGLPYASPTGCLTSLELRNSS